MSGEATAEEVRRRALSEMCAAIAHEIRNPLGSMELYTTLLKKDLRHDPGLCAFADQIQLGIRSIERIVSNCLQFTGDVSPHREAIENPVRFLDETIGLARSTLEKHGVIVEIRERSSGRACVDPYQVRQIVLNVVVNAIEAAAERTDGEPPRVEIESSFPEPGRWTVVVRDNGFGIPQRDLERLGEPFFTTKVGGSGLGLAIARSFVNAHGGRLSFSSPGGAMVHIELPDSADHG